MNNLNENFFVIDSNNLNETKTKMCGFSIDENGCIQTNENLNLSKLTRIGAYVYIDVDDDEIKIYQDFNGSYGLYLYQNEDYFALSNSFIKLTDYLKDTENIISLNKDYANSFLFADLVSIAYEETLVNEIKSLPRNCVIHINKSDKIITFKEIDFEEHTVELDSQEGIEILDRWFYKWVSIFRYVKSISNNVTVDLTGGFDSRVVSAIWLNANINLDEIRINSYNDDKHCHPEDFRIASEIAREFNFQLNKNNPSSKINFDNVHTPILNSFYPKLCFHTEMNFKPFKYKYPSYHFTGSAGECLRGYPNTTADVFLEDLKRRVGKHNPALNESVERLFERTLEKLSTKYNLDKDSKEIMEIHYNETRTRLHYGKQAVEYFFANDYSLNPFFDEDLYKLKLTTNDCDDKKLLFALIYSRFCPKLLNFDFEGGRSIDDSTKEYAKELNKKFPLSPKEFDKISKNPDITEENAEPNPNSVTMRDIDRYLENIFYSRSFEMAFKKYFSDMSYREVHNLIKYANYFPLRSVYTSFGILKVINDIEFNNFRNKNEEYWFENFLENETGDNKTKIIKNIKLTKYITSRIDIKSFGKDNRIEILDNSDPQSSVRRPKWFKTDEGEGTVISSTKGQMDLKIKCVNDGKLKIYFRGIDFRTKNNERFPIYINYPRATVNGEEILKNKLLCHDEPIIFEKDVLDSETIEIHAEWEPISENVIFNNKLKLDNQNLKNKIEALQEENENTKKELYLITAENENIINEINDFNNMLYKKMEAWRA